MQNLLEEMMDVVEFGEKRKEGVEVCETVGDEILCIIVRIEAPY